ncbi:MAG: transglutaminase-like domain-containing protein, partial [Candidatus Micrarchaeota archaeon]
MVAPKNLSIYLCSLLLILSPPAFSFNAFLVQSANYSLLNEHIVDVSHGNVSDLRLNMSIPLDAEIILSSYPYTRENDTLSNPYISVLADHPQMPFNFSAYMKVRTNATSIKSLPALYSIPDEYAPFLASTQRVPSDDLQIKKIALGAVAGEQSDFEKISALAYWVHSYVNYNLSYVNQNQSVYDILSGRYGVCGDYSLLFATLSRSLGYPTRFVNGYAYSSVQQEWVGHAWNEVYIGEWVPVDATWLEVGSLDATHVPVSKLDTDSYSLASVSALVYPQDAKLFWQGVNQLRNVPANNLMVEGSYSLAPEQNFQASISNERIGAGQNFIVYLKYPAHDYRILRAYLAPCTSDSGGIVDFEQKEQWAPTKPGQASYLIWEGKSHSDIEQNVRYRCPLTINTDYLEKATVVVEVQILGENPQPPEAAASKSEVSSSQLQSINVQADKNSQTAYMVENGLFDTKALDENGAATFEFFASKPGRHTAYVWTDASPPAIVHYGVSGSSSTPLFEIKELPSYIQGEQALVKINFNADSNESLGGKILRWSWANQSG